MTYVLSTIGDRTYIITEQQHQEIAGYIREGKKLFYLGKSLIVTHQITGIDPIDTYKRQMKTKLAIRGERMCDRCGTIVPRMDKCPCKEQPDKYPDIMAQARLENPALDQYLTALAERKSLPSA